MALISEQAVLRFYGRELVHEAEAICVELNHLLCSPGEPEAVH